MSWHLTPGMSVPLQARFCLGSIPYCTSYSWGSVEAPRGTRACDRPASRESISVTPAHHLALLATVCAASWHASARPR